MGNPIYPLRGVKRELQATGFNVGAMKLQLIYDSTTRVPGSLALENDPNPRVLGPLWSSTLHRSVVVQANGAGAVVGRGDGSVVSFTGSGGGIYTASADSRDRLITITGGFRYFNAAAMSEETYDSAGRLGNVVWARGDSISLAYSDANTPSEIAPAPGYLISVTDSRGRSLNLKYGLSGRLTQVSDLAGQVLAIGYNGQGYLGSLTWNDGSTRAYVYENPAYPWALTGVVDELSTRYATFGYDSEGRAISSEHSGGVDRYAATYGTPPKIITTEQYDSTKQIVVRNQNWVVPQGASITSPLASNALGTVSIGGKTYLASQSQPAGSGCAASTSSQTFDANGNLSSRDDFNGKRACYLSDTSRNLETTRVEGLANTQACSAVTGTGATLPIASRKVSTAWHPDWRLEAKRAEPGKLTTSIYNGQPDPFNGGALANCTPSTALLPDGKPIAVLCKQIEQATTDANGSQGFSASLQSGVSSRIQEWTYNSTGQMLTAKDPVNNTTTYTYYSDTTADHTLGDLQAITNAKNQATTYTKYNKLGQVLESTDPNGAVTTNTYDLRQRVLSTTVGGQTTSYEYDPAGQLLKVTNPDQSWMGYEYDAAHRQTAIKDSLGNRIEYVLDNAGNRTSQSAKDPGGNLARSLSRSIDALGRVQQTTGRE